MEYDEIPKLPQINEKNYPTEDHETILQELKKSKRKLILYESDSGEFCCLFSNLDHLFYAGFVALLSNPGKHYEDVNNLLKLCLEGVRLTKQNTKKGHATAIRVESYLKSQKLGFKAILIRNKFIIH